MTAGPRRNAGADERASSGSRIEEYWDWFAAALFLVITVDMVTTVYAAAVVGNAAEANPLTRWAITQGMGVFAAINVLATVGAVGVFAILMRLLRRAEPPGRRVFALATEVWLGLLLTAGLFVFANNLSVIFLGESLF
ncbi:MAG: hypothetical protein ABEJ67_02450 [Halanaeroarchaeum sp.]